MEVKIKTSRAEAYIGCGMYTKGYKATYNNQDAIGLTEEEAVGKILIRNPELLGKLLMDNLMLVKIP